MKSSSLRMGMGITNPGDPYFASATIVTIRAAIMSINAAA